MAEPANADQTAYWNGGVGVAWAELQARMDVQLAPLGRAALDALAPRPGQRLLDVGCGCGATSLELARAVGPSGHVTGLDISHPMLALARARPRSAQESPVEFQAADAQTFAFASAAFDGVYSRFGVMFFADPPAAFSNLRRASKPDGRLAFVAWRAMAQNPMFTDPVEAGARHLPPPPPPPDANAPGPFALADEGRTRALLEGAGWREVAVSPRDLEISPGGLDDAMETSLAIGPLAARLRERPEARDAVAADLRATLQARLVDGSVRFPAAVWVVTARA